MKANPITRVAAAAGAREIVRKPTVRAPTPPALADVALCDIKDITAAAKLSASRWYELVQAGEAPQPVIRQARFTRWRLSAVRIWLIERASAGALESPRNERAGDATIARAKHASAAARAKRAASSAES